MNVKTNMARKFLQHIDKHFPKHHKFHKIFNRNNVKVSYSCMPNMFSEIRSHKQKILNNDKAEERADCNCRRKESCPLEGRCLTKSLVYCVHFDIKDKRLIPIMQDLWIIAI